MSRPRKVKVERFDCLAEEVKAQLHTITDMTLKEGDENYMAMVGGTLQVIAMVLARLVDEIREGREDEEDERLG